MSVNEETGLENDVLSMFESINWGSEKSKDALVVFKIGRAHV